MMPPGEPSLTIVRWMDAPPAKVFAALTDPAKIMRWWSPDAGPTLSAQVDVRPGGHFLTDVTLIHEGFPDEETRDSHRAGWQCALDKIQKLAV